MISYDGGGMAEKMGYRINVFEVFRIDEPNRRRDKIFSIDIKDIDLKKLLQYIVEISELEEGKSVQV